VAFPLTLQPLAINRPASVEAVNRALSGDRLLFLTLQNNDKDDPEPNELRPIGAVAAIRQMAKCRQAASMSSSRVCRARRRS
jgi:ATP-dependent Lon protease